MFGFDLGDWVGHDSEWISVTSKYCIGFGLLSPNEVDKNTATERKHVRVVFKAHGFIFNVKYIPSGGIYSVHSPSRNVWNSRPLVAVVLHGCLSMHASVKLYWTASNDLYINPPEQVLVLLVLHISSNRYVFKTSEIVLSVHCHFEERIFLIDFSL